MKKHQNKIGERVVASLLWLFSIGLFIGYQLDVNLFPITDWVSFLYEPIYNKLFGGAS